MKRKDLLKKLDECILLEEEAAPIYGVHLHALINILNLDEIKQQTILPLLEELGKNCRYHKEAFEKLKSFVKRSKKDAF